MVTSRYVDSIAEELDNYQPFEIRVNKADIELFIEKQSRRIRICNRPWKGALPCEMISNKGSLIQPKTCKLLLYLVIHPMLSE